MQSELLQKIEHDAAHGEPCPKDLKPPETMLYYMLLGVYSAYQAGKITKEQGHDKKNEVYAVYNRIAAEYKQFTEITILYQRRIREGYSVGGKDIIRGEQKNDNINNGKVTV